MGIAVKTNALIKLPEIGQSPWYDNIDRRFIKNGRLKRLFETGILGVTSNPTIFEKAVSASHEYDEAIKKLYAQGNSVLEIYDTLTVQDVSMAADLLRPTYEASGHVDGYVSIEVLPEFAHDPRKTIENAREIFNRIGKPNIMIKVPGTAESAEAIRALIRDGINVNVTLLFSERHYRIAAEAYLEGLQERLNDGKDIGNVCYVASVFISRIDTKVDGILDRIKNKALKGKIAVANTKMIYQLFKEIFASEEFEKLKSEGGNIQRPLWASTSTKNPIYSDVKYVDELIGVHTINTMPPSTIDAFLDHGNVELTIEKGLDEERSYLERLKMLGMDIDALCQQIQDEGVAAFQASFDKLIHAIEQKMRPRSV